MHAGVAAVLVSAPGLSSAELRSVAVERANFRTGPSTDEEVIFVADRLFPVEVLATEEDWLLVRDFEGVEAWVASWLLGDTRTVVVTADVVNIRVDPSTDGTVSHTAERGAAFLVVDRREGWVRVADEVGAIGWVHKNLLWGSTE
jgi:SH3-like domain-containing protein